MLEFCCVVQADLFSYPSADARRYNRDPERENRQFASRWTTLRFRHEIPEAERNVVLKPCGRCAAAWYGEVADRVMAAGPPTKVSEDGVRACPPRAAPGTALPSGPPAPLTSTHCDVPLGSFPPPVVVHERAAAPGALACSRAGILPGAAALTGGQLLERLAQLMAWQQQGLLSPEEFAKLKAKLCE